MDDIEEKARRNLVMYSAAIITIAFLEIPLDGNLIGVVNLDRVNPSKAWVAAAAVQIYLFLRFHHAPQVWLQRLTWSQERRDSLRRIITEQVQVDAWFTATGKARSFPELVYTTFGERAVMGVVSKYPVDIELESKRERRNGNWTQSMPWCGRCTILWDCIPPDDKSVYLTSGEFRITKLGHFVLRWRSLRDTSLIRWNLLELSVAYVLGGTALIVCLHRV